MDQNKEKKHGVVQTYAEDMARVLEDDKSGLIKKIIHEEEEHEIEKRNLSPESNKNKLFMFLGFLFILMSLIVLLFFLFGKSSSTVSIEKQFVPIIFVDQNNFLEVKDLNKDKIAQTVSNEVNTTKVKNGGVEGIYFTENKQIIGLREFISLIKANFIPDNNAIFIYDNFLTGIVNSESDLASTPALGSKDFFILIKVRSVADVFDIFHAWENKMFSDLHGFFGVDISPETKYLFTKGFQDGIIGNKNARVLYDNDNKIVMAYIFANDNSVIITNTENAGKEIMHRLASSQVGK